MCVRGRCARGMAPFLPNMCATSSDFILRFMSKSVSPSSAACAKALASGIFASTTKSREIKSDTLFAVCVVCLTLPVSVTVNS